MNLGIDLKVDYAFKWTFGAQERIGNLQSLLQYLLSGRLRGPIDELAILNPIQDREAVDGKLSVLDILARDRSGTQYHIEMQLVGFKELPKRFLYYLARTYSSQLQIGDDYDKLSPVISIIILNDVMFPGLSGYHHVFQMREITQGKVFCDDIEIHVIELPKFEKRPKELDNGCDQWLYLIRHSQDLDPEFPPPELTVPEVVQTLKELEIMSHTEQERLLYDAREKAQRDELWRRNWSLRQRDEGLQEGLQKGQQEERELSRRKMKLISQINHCEMELGQQVSSIEELFELSEVRLQQVLSDLGKPAS